MNFRDFGGMAAAGGTIVRGRLFRCGQIGPSGTITMAELSGLDPAVIVDMRFPDEARDAPMPWPAALAERRILLKTDMHGDAPHHTFFKPALRGLEDVHARYRAFYRNLPGDPRYRALAGAALRAFASADGPILIHCSAGKDRTGFLSALLLTILGADRAAMIADFVASSTPEARANLRPEIERRFAAHGQALPEGAIIDAILGVVPDYLDAAFDTMRGDAGTIETYLAGIGVGPDVREALRARFVTQAEG